jgi:hypothetical protein
LSDRAGQDGIQGHSSEGSSDAFLYFGALAGVAGLLSIVVDFLTPSASSAQNQLSSFQGDPNGYALYLFPLAFAFLVSPFFLSLTTVLRQQGAGLARVGPLVILLALLSLGIAGAFEFGGYWAASITAAPSTAIQAYEAAFWSNVNNAWEAVSIYGVGLGSLLLAWALRQARDVPSWMPKLAWVGAALDFAGAILASMSGYYSALSVGFVLPVFGLVILIVFAFALPRAFRRARRSVGATPPAKAQDS